MKSNKVEVEKQRNVDEKIMRNQKRNVELWGVLLGLPLWLTLLAVFYISGIYVQWGKSALIRFFGDDPNIVFTLITLPGSVAVMVALITGAGRLAMRVHNSEPFKIALTESIDLFLWLNLTSVWMGLTVHYTFYPVYSAVPILGLTAALLLASAPPIVGIPFILDFVMPMLWRRLFGYNYGYFQGKLLRNLKRSWRKGDLQKDFRRHLVGAVILVFSILVVLVVLALMGLLK